MDNNLAALITVGQSVCWDVRHAGTMTAVITYVSPRRVTYRTTSGYEGAWEANSHWAIDEAIPDSIRPDRRQSPR